MSVVTAQERHPRLAAATKYTTAVLLTVFCWALVLPAEDPSKVPAIVAVKVNLDLLIGLLALVLLPARRRFGFGVAILTSVLLVFSSAVTGAWVFATISLAERRSVARSTVVVLLAAAASMASMWWLPPVTGEDDVPWGALLVVILLVYTLVTAVGFYLGARRDLVASWRERAETAEREQASRMAQARVAERTRIAREMHDVLAHRISTVAMHSGALAYRDDLDPEQVRGTARLIQENAHTALIELRDILGVLRDDSAEQDRDPGPEPPQPTIADLAALVEDAAAVGQEVHLRLDVDPDEIPTGLGRHVYRSVQECLTNARKHAGGAPVDVRIVRSRAGRDDDLVVEVRNPLLPGPGHGSHDGEHPGHVADARRLRVPPSGVGLLGLAERADLAGGRLEHGPQDDHYVTRLTVPWPERSTA